MKKIFDQLTKRGKNYSSKIFEYKEERIEDSEEADKSAQFLGVQKNRLICLKQHFDRYVNTLLLDLMAVIWLELDQVLLNPLFDSR